MFTIRRAEWEESGYTVAAHTNSPPLDWSRVDQIVLHYPGHNGVTTIPTRSQLMADVRGMQRYYVDVRDYSLGYNAVVGGGMSVEVRGDTFRNAANKPANETTFSIQARVDGMGDQATAVLPADVAEINRLIGWAEQEAGRTMPVVGHRDIRSTACPGQATYDQIQAGVFGATGSEPEMIFTQGRVFDSTISTGTTYQVNVGRDVAGNETGAAGASGVIVNIAVINPTKVSYLRAWAATEPEPATSHVNWDEAGRDVSNAVAVGLSAGHLALRIPHASARVIVDLQAIVP